MTTATRIPDTRTSVPINRARVRAAALVGARMARGGVDFAEAAALAADLRDVPEAERVAVLVDVERLVLAESGGDA